MDERTLEIIKWVLIIFLTGFIAQFGKSLSQWIQRVFGRKKKQNKQETKERRGSPGRSKEELQAKIEKKRLKTRAKARKKRR